MNLDQLAAFVAVVQHGSVTVAAQHLGISQPAASRRLARLQDDLDATLVQLRAGSVTVTPIGERVLAHAIDILHEADALHSTLGSGPAPLRGVVRVAASTVPSEHLVPRIVADFVAEHPAVRVEVSTSDTRGVITRLRERGAEVGFTGRPVTAPGWTSLALWDDEVILIAPADHPATSQALEPSDVVHQRFVLREAGSGTQEAFHDALRAAGGELPLGGPGVRVDHAPAVLAAVRAGAGLGIVSRRALEGTAGGGLAQVHICDVEVRRHLHLVHETDRLRFPPADAFLTAARRTSPPGADVDERSPG